ncbi:MAG: gas vesicle protein GvpG [Candidatus Binataceae bacterium]
MLLIDDLILAPGTFVLWILRQVHEAAEKELDQEGERLSAEIGELHRRLEAGAIDERAFDAREREILDRLDELRARGERQPSDDGL